MLTDMDTVITDAVTLAQVKYGGALVNRDEQRDLDWFIEVTNRNGCVCGQPLQRIAIIFDFWRSTNWVW